MDLKETLQLHALWVQGDKKGVRANLRGADLYGADLYGADLSGTNLSGANLWGCVGNMREVKSAQFEQWALAWTKDTLQIGCQRHKIDDWFKFTDDQITDMDQSALVWWKKWKDTIRSLVVAD